MPTADSGALVGDQAIAHVVRRRVLGLAAGAAFMPARSQPAGRDPSIAVNSPACGCPRA